ncbi:MerR family transcriptional regulator [Alicyclobacillus contaminans]|uniref:MerR family transcriptional regulator n=1 Tax=Alicyclobacillus contaminans TaxID=392016 RepID=UPI00041CD479|nr:MerR family transcriptional regulator [Alicyclobacillus contaminans]GMA49687.1 MerR family transcriptional regulator [Alicyclobacillus contaminans]
MDRKFYRINDFAKKSSVSVRTLQFYDKKGLLSPSQYTPAGHRLYSDDDLVRLQQILALKYLGFSLTEIKNLIEEGASELSSALRAQKKMLLDKRQQIDSIIHAIEKIEKLETETLDFQAITKIIEVMQMDLKPEWVSKYLAPDERRTLRDIALQSFSKEALRRLAQHDFTEETHQQYSYFYDELRRLVAQNEDPASEAAQRLAEYLTDLNRRRSQGWDQEILSGMMAAWENFNALPEDKKPQMYVLTTKEREFIKQACSILHARRSRESH